MNHHFSRRRVLLLAPALLLAAYATSALAIGLDAFTNQEATGGLRAALEQGASTAVGRLGVADGFLGNPKLRINLPSALEKVRPMLAMTGQGQKLDDLVVSMNRAAEQAVPLAKPLLIQAVRSMNVEDAKRILAGGDTSVTEFFRSKTADQLGAKFLPIVKGVTDKSGLATQYNALAGQAAGIGLLDGPERSVEGYVTNKALAGLFTAIGDEEKAIRANPVEAGSKLAQQVFGALR